MIVEAHFPTLIGVSDDNFLSDLDNYKSICNNIFQTIDNDKKFPFAESKLSTSFWHQQYGHLDQDERFNNLKEFILSEAIVFADVLGYGVLQKSNLKFTNMWVNFIFKNDYHALHIHSTTGASIISGVFYVDAPNDAYLKFGSPYRDSYVAVPETYDNVSNYKMVSYECKPGRLIIFKSNVYHGYDAHLNDQVKISIPFNLTIEL